jgi:predicted lipoprotein with Yx(FWY)xxD motif
MQQRSQRVNSGEGRHGWSIRGFSTGHRHSRLRRIVASFFLSLGVITAPVLIGTQTTVSAAASGTVITVAPGTFGNMLVVGSGKFAGYSLYFISSDQPHNFGCTTQLHSLGGPAISCTGSPNDQHAEWPAITTKGAPIAGPGVSQRLLGSVNRKGIGRQVTYAGHPLYLFDQGPGQITGEGWDEPSLPPYHGVWWLMTPGGIALPWPGILAVTTIADGRKVLGAIMLTGGGFKTAPVYTFSKDRSHKVACVGACEVAWPPVLTESRPAATKSVHLSKIGSIKRPNGTYQVTYAGRPLYLDANESVVLKNGQGIIAGSGEGAILDGGVFKLVSP